MKTGFARVVAVACALIAGSAARAAGLDVPPHCVLPGPRLPGIAARDARAPVARGGGPSVATAATTGPIRMLVLLAEFADFPHKLSPARIDDHLFGPGMSLRTYYTDVSGGRIDVSADVYGWFTLPRSEFSYSQGNGGLGTYPNNGQSLAEDAVAAAITQGLDLADYDADGDDVVDALLVIHSGEGFEWAGSSSPALTPFPDPDAINSHKWSVVDGDFGQGARVVDYFTCPELQRARPVFFPSWTDSIATVGVFCHEFGHVLGLPDFYDTQTAESRIGAWEVMDAGLWSFHPTDPALSLPGSLPSHFSAWSKLFLGWTESVRVTPAIGEVLAADLTLDSASDGGSPLQLRTNPFEVDWTATVPGRGEFFVAEARSQSGWDAGLPGEGLIVYHVDESRAGNRAADYADGAGLVLLEARDGNVGAGQDATDPWPGGETTFGPTSDPSSALHDGSASGVVVDDISLLSGGRVSLSATVTNLFAEVALPFARPHPFRPEIHGSVSLVLNLDAIPPSESVAIFDVVGRRVRGLAPASPPQRVVSWDGRDDEGRGVPAGVYFLRTSRGALGRIVLLRN